MGKTNTAKTPRFKRILLKVSGEALMGDGKYGIHPPTLTQIATDISDVHRLGVEIAIVIGGGNIFRGIAASASGMDRASADYMGMLATVINGLALQDATEKLGVATRVQTAIEMSQLAEPYIRRRAVRHLEKGRIVIFAAGTGNPYFTTDTAGLASRDGDSCRGDPQGDQGRRGLLGVDPAKDPNAIRFRTVSYLDVLKKNLQVMDSTAISLCMDNDLPIVVFDLHTRGNIQRVVLGEEIGTRVGRVKTERAGGKGNSSAGTRAPVRG